MNKFIYKKKAGVFYPVERVESIHICFFDGELKRITGRKTFDEKTDLDNPIWFPRINFEGKEFVDLSKKYFTYKECEALVKKYFDFLNDSDEQVFVIDYEEEALN